MGILKTVAASRLNDSAGRVLRAERELRRAQRQGASDATIAGAKRAVEHAEGARSNAQKAFDNADD
jgi:hypothetical protein